MIYRVKVSHFDLSLKMEDFYVWVRLIIGRFIIMRIEIELVDEREDVTY